MQVTYFFDTLLYASSLTLVLVNLFFLYPYTYYLATNFLIFLSLLNLNLFNIFPISPSTLSYFLFSDGWLSFKNTQKIVSVAFCHPINNICIIDKYYQMSSHCGILDTDIFSALQAIKYAVSIQLILT
jgi:hypothetical protein